MNWISLYDFDFLSVCNIKMYYFSMFIISFQLSNNIFLLFGPSVCSDINCKHYTCSKAQTEFVNNNLLC